LAEAEAIYRQVLVTDPSHADALHMLGVLANQLGRADVAADLIQRAIQLESGRAIYHNNLGIWGWFSRASEIGRKPPTPSVPRLRLIRRFRQH
jgi:Flp pilus assembly protein TadD